MWWVLVASHPRSRRHKGSLLCWSSPVDAKWLFLAVCSEYASQPHCLVILKHLSGNATISYRGYLSVCVVYKCLLYVRYKHFPGVYSFHC